MITIVIYFRSQVVIFIFGGRNSGQNAKKERRRLFLKVADEPVVCNCHGLILRAVGEWSVLQDGFVNFRLARDPGTIQTEVTGSLGNII